MLGDLWEMLRSRLGPFCGRVEWGERRRAERVWNWEAAFYSSFPLTTFHSQTFPPYQQHPYKKGGRGREQTDQRDHTGWGISREFPHFCQTHVPFPSLISISEAKTSENFVRSFSSIFILFYKVKNTIVGGGSGFPLYVLRFFPSKLEMILHFPESN